MYYNNQLVCGQKLIRDVITDRSIPLYAKLPCVDDPEWKNRELVCNVEMLEGLWKQAKASNIRSSIMKRVFKQNPFYIALELDSEWLSAFESIVTKIALPELELISIWGIVFGDLFTIGSATVNERWVKSLFSDYHFPKLRYVIVHRDCYDYY